MRLFYKHVEPVLEGFQSAKSRFAVVDGVDSCCATCRRIVGPPQEQSRGVPRLGVPWDCCKDQSWWGCCVVGDAGISHDLNIFLIKRWYLAFADNSTVRILPVTRIIVPHSRWIDVHAVLPASCVIWLTARKKIQFFQRYSYLGQALEFFSLFWPYLKNQFDGVLKLGLKNSLLSLSVISVSMYKSLGLTLVSK